jgi:hypothetical protein
MHLSPSLGDKSNDPSRIGEHIAMLSCKFIWFIHTLVSLHGIDDVSDVQLLTTQIENRYIGVAQPFYSLALFTPTIIKELGYTNANANLLSVPPYALGFITTILVALASDRLAKRGIFIVGGMTAVIVGYIILLCDVAVGVKYCKRLHSEFRPRCK